MRPFSTRREGQDDDYVGDLTFSHSTIKTEASGHNIKSLLLKKYDTV